MINIPKIKVGEKFKKPIYVERIYNDEKTSKSIECLRIISRCSNLEVYCLSVTLAGIGLTYRKFDYFNDNCKEITEEEFEQHIKDYFNNMLK